VKELEARDVVVTSGTTVSRRISLLAKEFP